MANTDKLLPVGEPPVFVNIDPALLERRADDRAIKVPDIEDHFAVRAEPRHEDDRKTTNPKDLVGSTKPPMSPVSKLVLAEVGVAMFEGMQKYGRHNYRGTEVLASVYLDATNRHLTAWEEGEDIDPGSGMSHITKAIASLTVLRDAQIVGKLVDDRPPAMAPKGFWEDLETKVKGIIAKYGHIKPKHYTEKNRHEN